MDIFGFIRRFRAWLDARDARAQREVLRAYEEAWKAIDARLSEVTRRMEASAEDASPSLLNERERLRELGRQVEAEIRRVGRAAAEVAEREQGALVRAAEKGARTLLSPRSRVAGVGVSFDRLPARVIENLVGVATDGSPVRELFDQIARDLGLETGGRVTRALVQGAALGRNPTEIARMVRREADARGGNSARQPAVARRLNQAVRTESYRAMREASRAAYEATGTRWWRWVAALTPSTCVICWAMHGKLFPSTVPMQSHVACRCVMVPVTDPDEEFETGAERFARASPGHQKQILGDKAFDLYRRGEVDLDSFVAVRHSERWGASRFRLSSDEARRRTLASLNTLPEVKNARVEMVGDAKAALSDLVGREVSSEEAARLFGAADGASVRVERRGERVFAQMRHADFKRHDTFLGRDAKGNLFLALDDIESARGRTGAGLRSFATMVEAAREAGVRYVDAYAEGRPGSKMTGYCVWPRFGFEAPLTGAEIAALPDELREARTLNDLHEAEGGEWWRQHGSGRRTVFTLDDESRQLALLKRYLRRKGLRLR